MTPQARALLEDRVAIVIGGGRGIGAATTAVLAEAGAAVSAASRTWAQVSEVADKLRLAGGAVMAIQADLSDGAQVHELCQRTLERFGNIDFVVNCAASTESIGQLAWEVEPESWQGALDTNLRGLYHISRSVVPYMLAQGSGRLLNVSSNLGELAVPRASVYCAARAAANSFFRVLGKELLGTGVTANVVYPGVVDTPGLRSFRGRLLGGWEGQEPHPQLMPAEDPVGPAKMLLWLCSPATEHLTGQILRWNDPAVRRRVTTFCRWYAGRDDGSEQGSWNRGRWRRHPGIG